MRVLFLAALLTATATAQAVLGASPVSKTACPASHPVKGNIVDRGKDKGAKIYHTPDSRSYKATHPERCFRTAAEAQKAGYKPPRK